MAADARPVAIALMGPTASGKTALALEWAQRCGGEIVSVDSALVYHGLDIGAAKPDAAQRARAPHHLIDLREPWQPYSAAEFATDARVAIADIVARGKLPILAGGTGLYFHALLHGLSPMPQADPGVRAAIAAEAARQGWPALHAELGRVDPDAAARIHVTDPQRIQRALEVYRISGRRISDWQREAARDPLPLRVLKLVLAPRVGDGQVDRVGLHARIEQRFDMMLATGLLDEVRALRALPELQAVERPLDLPALRAVGYRQAWEYLDAAASPSPTGKGGNVSRGQKEKAVAAFRDRAIFATRQLAKRQLTWLRGEFDARWFDPQADRGALELALALFLNGTRFASVARRVV